MEVSPQFSGEVQQSQRGHTLKHATVVLAQSSVDFLGGGNAGPAFMQIMARVLISQ
jgi:hypothetical protein